MFPISGCEGKDEVLLSDAATTETAHSDAILTIETAQDMQVKDAAEKAD